MTTTATLMRYYRNILLREPADSELAELQADLDAGRLTLATIRDSLITSDESSTYVQQVIRLYQAAFNRLPDEAGLTYWVNGIRDGSLTTSTLIHGFTHSAEWSNLYGSSEVSPSLLVTIYQNALGREISEAEIAAWLASGVSLDLILLGVANSTESQTHLGPFVNTLQQHAAETDDLSNVFDGTTDLTQIDDIVIEPDTPDTPDDPVVVPDAPGGGGQQPDTSAPSVDADQSFDIAENSNPNTVIGSVQASDDTAVTGYQITAGNEAGFFAIDATGQITLTEAGAVAAANDFETGPNSFDLTVTATDAAGNTSAGETVTVNVTDVVENTPPQATAQTLTTAEDTPNGGTVGGTDAEEDDLTFALVENSAVGGTVSSFDTNTGAFTFTPDTDFSGAASFQFTASDAAETSAPATIIVNVAGQPDIPIVRVQAPETTVEGDPFAITLTAEVGDTDNPGNTEQIAGTVLSGLPAGFQVADRGNNSATSDGGQINVTNWDLSADLIVTPTNDFNGDLTLTLSVSVTENGITIADIQAFDEVAINPVNDAPVIDEDASNLAVSGDEDTELTGMIVASDADGDMLTYALAANGAPQHGTVVFDDNGAYTFSPAANYNGSDGFTVEVSDGEGGSDTATVTVTIDPVNDAPVATAQSLSTNEDEALNSTVAGTDTENDNLTFALVENSAVGGTVTSFDTDTGAFTFTPAADFEGDASFQFTANDGNQTSAPATIAIDVDPVNDAPVATAQSLSTNEDVALNGTVAGTDTENDDLTFALVENSAVGGTVTSFDTDTGAFTFTPAADFEGDASFQFTANDGNQTSAPATIAIDVDPVNDAPVATAQSLSTNEDEALNGTVAGTDTENDNLTFALVENSAVGGTVTSFDTDTGAFTFTPAADFEGDASFQFTANDGNLTSAPATIAIDVDPVNDAPVATAQSLSTNEDVALNGTVAGTDTENDDLTFALVENSAVGGTVTSFDPDTGAFTFTPAADFEGDASFQFTANDGNLTSAPATIAIDVDPVNDAPVATAQSLSTNEDVALNGTVAGTDTENDDLTFALVENSAVGGTVTSFDPDTGAFTFTPAADFEGDASFQFTANDGNQTSAPATIAIDVDPVNDAPVATAQSLSTNEDVALNGTVAGTDTENDDLTFALVENSAVGGTVTSFDTDTGAFTFTPAADFEGDASFQFTANDGNQTSAPATIAIDVDPVNDAPVATAQSLSTNEDVALNGTVAGTDTENDDLTFALVENSAVGGTVTSFDTDTGAFTFTPAADFEGDASFQFTANDGNQTSAPATIAIDVDPVNDAPVLVGAGTPAAIDEAGDASNQDIAPVTGNLTVSDADAGDTLTGSIDGDPVISWSGGTLGEAQQASLLAALGTGRLSFDGSIAATGEQQALAYTWDPAATDLDFLATGQALTITYQVAVSDGTETTAAQPLVFTISGTEDRPVAVDDDGATDAAFRMNEDDGATEFDVRANDTFDLDAGASNSIVVQTQNFVGFPTGITANDVNVTVTADNKISVELIGGEWDQLNAGDSGIIEINYRLDGDNSQVSAGLLSIRVEGTNDAPILDPTVDITAMVEEDAQLPGEGEGILVSNLVDLVGGGGLDNVTEDSLVTGIAITATNTDNGSWHYSINNGAEWVPFSNISDVNSLTLLANARIAFVPNADYSGTIADALTIRAWDGTEGANGFYFTTTTNGGMTAFSSQTDTVAITINAVNDAPTINSEQNVTIPENTTAVIMVTSSDIDGGAPAYSISGGADQNLFDIDEATGALSFLSAPDHGNPQDAGGNNIYDVEVTASDGNGGSDSQAIAVTVADAPAVDLGSYQETFTAGGDPVIVAGAVTLLSAEMIASATVDNVSVTHDEEFLAVAPQVLSGTGITASYDSNDGKLTLTGDADAATYQTVLRQITFDSSDPDPTYGDTQTTRVFTIKVVNVSGTESNLPVEHVLINVAPFFAELTDATFTAADVAATPQTIDAEIAFADTGYLGLLNGTLTVSGFVDGEDVISVRNEGTDPGQIGFSGGTVTFGGTEFGTATGGSGSNDFVVTFNGEADAAAVDALIENLTYANAAPVTETRTLTITVTDHQGEAASQTATVTVTGITAPPVATAQELSTNEDTPLSGTVTGTDAQDDDLTFAVVANSETGGTVTITDPDTGAFTFAPTANFSGEASFQFTANDGSETSDPATVSIDVAPVADAPTLSVEAVSPAMGFGEFQINQEFDSSQRVSSVLGFDDGRFIAVWHSSDGDVDSSASAISIRVGTPQAGGTVTWGDEEAVNFRTPDTQDQPSITSLGGNQFLALWRSYDVELDTDSAGIAARVGTLETDGSISWGAELKVNQNIAGAQNYPQGLLLSDGRILVTWTGQDAPGDSSQWGVSGRIGTPQQDGSIVWSEEFGIAVDTYGTQYDPQISELPDGRLAFAWQSGAFYLDGSNDDIATRIATPQPDGSLSWGPEETVNQLVGGNQVEVDLITLQDGSLLFVWQSGDPNVDGSQNGIAARIGVPQNDGSIVWGNEFRVNQEVSSGQYTPEVLQLSDGRLAFVWESGDPDIDPSPNGISARIGTPLENGSIEFDDEFAVNINKPDSQNNPQLAELSDRRLLITWTTNDETVDGSNNAIVGRIFDPNSGFVEDTSFALDIEASLADGDGSETLSLFVSGLPAGFAIGDGTSSATSTGTGHLIEISGWTLATLQVPPATGFTGDLTINITATASDSAQIDGATVSDTSSETRTVSITVDPANEAPEITSAETAAIPENTAAVVTLAATDAENDPLTFRISGGADWNLFEIEGDDALKFKSAPDFETPGSADDSNIYEVEVSVSDTNGGTDSQTVTVTVEDVLDTPNQAPTISAPTLTFAESTVQSASLPNMLDSADFNGDGAADFIGAVGNQREVTLYLSDGTTVPTYTGQLVTDDLGFFREVIAADVNGDGYTDIVTTQSEQSIPAVAVFLHNGDNAIPGFVLQYQDIPRDIPNTAAVADFNGDGHTDIVAVERSQSQIIVFTNDGNAATDFDRQFINTTATGLNSVVAKDVNGDGHTDFVMTSSDDNSVLLFLNDGNATPIFTEHVITTGETQASLVDIGDVNGDGLLDIVVASALGISLHLNTGNGAGNLPGFNRQEVFNLSLAYEQVTLADMNGDGAADIVFSSYADDSVRVLVNDGASAPAFFETVATSSANGASGFTIDDFNLDGRPDIMVSAREDNQILLLGNSGLMTVNEDTPFTFSNQTLITIGDPDAGTENVRVRFEYDQAHGTLAPLPENTPNLHSTGEGPGLLILTGTVANINAAMDGMTFTPAANFNGTVAINATVDDLGNAGTGGALSQTVSIPIAFAPVNDDPIISSAAVANIGENTTSVMTVTAVDPDNDPLTFTVSGGTDQELFEIDTNGALNFKVMPDFENPADHNLDNTYAVEITVSDGNGGSDSQTISVTVDDAVGDASEINWFAIPIPDGKDLPTNGDTIANLNSDAPIAVTYALAEGSATGFEVTPGGVVNLTADLTQGTHTLFLSAITAGGTFTERVDIFVGTTGANNFSFAIHDHDSVVYGAGERDSVHSGSGNDIVLLSSDEVHISFLGAGDDKVYLQGDQQSVFGDSGFDSLIIAKTDMDLTNSGLQFNNIEQVDMRSFGDNTLTTTAHDLLQMVQAGEGETNTLRVLGSSADADNVVLMGTGWMQQTDTTIDGVTYEVWENNLVNSVSNVTTIVQLIGNGVSIAEDGA